MVNLHKRRLVVSKEEDKIKHSKRLHKETSAIVKQQKIARQHTTDRTELKLIDDQPHRFAKHHAMDCGNPQCPVCGNPRQWHQLTAQEKRQRQEMDIARMRHSNGLLEATD